MNFRRFDTPRLQEFHARIRQRLAQDDAEPGALKRFSIPSDTEWRQASDAIEAELQRRASPVQCIDWSENSPETPQSASELDLDSSRASVIHHEELLWQFFTGYYLDWAMHHWVLNESEDEEAIFISARTLRVLEDIVGAERLRLCLGRWAAEEYIEILGPHKLLRAEEPCVKIRSYIVEPAF